jgi:hypothetical protein
MKHETGRTSINQLNFLNSTFDLQKTNNTTPQRLLLLLRLVIIHETGTKDIVSLGYSKIERRRQSINNKGTDSIMPSRHIKLEILLVSIIIFILMTDYTLLLDHPSTRVGLITQNVRRLLRQRQEKRLAAGRTSARGRRLEATHYLRQYSSNKPITITRTPSVEVRLGTYTLAMLPRDWWFNTARKTLFDSPDVRTAENKKTKA